MKKTSRKIRYVKVNDPELFAYFTPDSIKRYDPARAGWIRDDKVDRPAPDDVINFMNIEPVKVKQDPVSQDAVKEEPKVSALDFATISTRELEGMIKDLNEEQLLAIIKDDARTTAKKMAEKEIRNREL